MDRRFETGSVEGLTTENTENTENAETALSICTLSASSAFSAVRNHPRNLLADAEG
jgi:hypothetical protein